MKTKIIYSPKCLEYGGISSPENTQRINTAAQILQEKGFDFIQPQPCGDCDLLSVHNTEYVAAVKNSSITDPDTPAYNNIYEYAKLAVGGAILASQTNGFSLMRPPGHHAGINGKAINASTRGFCYFNNIAIAVKILNKKTLIIDIDGHHGNGTQEIFLGDPNITYLSLHKTNVYPGTGTQIQQNCYNFPLPDEYGIKAYLKTFKDALKQIGNQIKETQTIAISAGFDTHQGDLVSLGLETKDFGAISKEIKKLDKPTFFVLEGGYNGQNLGQDINSFLKEFES